MVSAQTQWGEEPTVNRAAERACDLGPAGSRPRRLALTAEMKRPGVSPRGPPGCQHLRARETHFQRPLAQGGGRIPTALPGQRGSRSAAGPSPPLTAPAQEKSRPTGGGPQVQHREPENSLEGSREPPAPLSTLWSRPQGPSFALPTPAVSESSGPHRHVTSAWHTRAPCPVLQWAPKGPPTGTLPHPSISMTPDAGLTS